MIDGAGNAANLSLTGLSQGSPQIDTTAPTVSSVTATAGSYNAGKVLTLTLNMSEAVTVTGTPTLTLNDGGTATYASGSGTNALTFSYTVASGQNTAGLAVTAVNGTIADLAGNAAEHRQTCRRLLLASSSTPRRLRCRRWWPPAPASRLAPATSGRQRGDADGQPERGGDGGGRHPDADAQRRRHRDLYRRLRQQCADLQLYGCGRPEHRRPGGDARSTSIRRPSRTAPAPPPTCPAR